MTYLLTRHAKSTHNVNNIFAGNRIDTSIVPQGKQETQKLALKILQKYDFDFIICSSLLRSYQTALIFKQAIKLKYKKSVPIKKSKYLDEVDVGLITGLTSLEAQNKFPLDYKNTQSKNIQDWNFTNGESYPDLQKRYSDLVKFLKPYQNKKVLIIGHAMFNQVILKNNLNLENFFFTHQSFIELSNFQDLL